jgi:putative transposase
LLAKLPQDDYPAINSRLFFQIWFTFVADKGVSSLRDLFHQLNHTGTAVNLSTFSKASKHRGFQLFNQVYLSLLNTIRKSSHTSDITICPFDSTVITLTSKLFWAESYHQVKLLTSINQETQATSEPVIHFGQDHDVTFGDKVISMLPEQGVAVGDRGFGSRDLIGEFIRSESLFVIRISRNWKLTETGSIKIGDHLCRVVCFCDVESQTEYRLATNIPEEMMSNQEIGEIYRQRWAIEVLWKFLKMHLKLDKLATKNINGVTIQIYMALIVYLLLLLVEVPKIYGVKLLDKLRFLQIAIRQEPNFVRWMNCFASAP